MARSGEPRREDLDDAVPTPAARREIRVGVFAILGVAAALVTLFALTDPGMFRGRYAVETHVADAGGEGRPRHPGLLQSGTGRSPGHPR